MMDRRSFLAGLTAPAVLAFAAKAQSAVRRETLRVAPETLTNIFDPHFTTSFTTRDFSYLVFDTLFAVNDRWEPRPQMIERWDRSADGWQRGHVRGLHGKPASLGQAGLIGATKTLEPIDARQFQLQLREPFGFVLDALAKPGAMVPMIMPRRLAETSPNRPVTEPIGSGPYRFVAEEYRPGDRIVLVRNAAYRARQEPSVWASGGKRARLERVELIAVPDVSSQVSALVTGELDYVERLPADVLPVLERNRNIRVQVVSPYGYQGILRINQLQPPFDDARVRRAVMLAVDQAQYLPAVAGRADYARECRSMYGCGTRYETTAGMPLAADLAAARQLLARSGADLTRVIVILHPANAPGLAALGLVTQDLLTRLGFGVDLQSMDLNTFFARRAKPEGWNVFHTTNTVPDMLTPLQNVYMNGAGAPDGFAGWPKDAEVERLRRAFAGTSDEGEHKRIAGDIHRRVAEAGFYMPLGQFVAASAWRSDLTDVPTGPAMFLWGIGRSRT